MSYSKDELFEVVQSIVDVYGDLHAAAIAFNLSHPVIASTVVGAKNEKQLLNNIAAYENSHNINNIELIRNFVKLDVYTEHR